MVHSGSYFLWLHWERRSGLSGVYIVIVTQWVAHSIIHQPLSLIQIPSHPAEVLEELRSAGVER